MPGVDAIPPLRTPGRARWLYFTLGWLCVALGLVGVVLPVLPTTPFLLLALWCFARSSPRFHGWLYHHRVFGPPLREWHEYRVIPLRAKILALAAMTASALYVLLGTNAPWYAAATMILVMAIGAGFILRSPSKRPAV